MGMVRIVVRLVLLSFLWTLLHPVTSLAIPPTNGRSNQIAVSTTEESATGRYSRHWETLLQVEHDERVVEIRNRRKQWSRSRLEGSGMSIFGALGQPDSDLLGEKVMRIVKPGESRWGDLFGRGDVLMLTTTSGVPREVLVTDVGADWMLVGVGPSWPAGVWEARKKSLEVRLDRTAPQAPIRAQRAALDAVRRSQAGYIPSLLAQTLASNSTESLSSSYLRTVKPVHEATVMGALKEAKSATAFRPNESQEDSIVWSLQRPLSLVRGPPGTGKTRTAALLISTAIRLGEKRVLAVTHSNGAADVLLEALLQMNVPAIRVGRPASVSSHLQYRTVVAMAEKHPDIVLLRERIRDGTLSTTERGAAEYKVKRCLVEVQKAMVDTAPVVVTTCVGAHQLVSVDAATIFSLVVLDEAAQTTEPALLCALAAAKADQLVLVGDTRQLPPTISSMALRATLGKSPMARLEQCGIEQRTLSIQYRMPRALLLHPSRHFYNGLVTCADETADALPPRGFPWPAEQPLAFVQLGPNLEVTHDLGGKSNPTEARVVAKVVSDLLAAGDVTASTVAIITPYAKQVQTIRSELNRQYNMGKRPRVGTVDSFQGKETDVVVISCVRSNDICELGFLRDSRRLCVAITRARRGLIIIGDKAVLQTCRHWAALLASCAERGCMMDGKCFSGNLKTSYVESRSADRKAALANALEEFGGMANSTAAFVLESNI